MWDEYLIWSSYEELDRDLPRLNSQGRDDLGVIRENYLIIHDKEDLVVFTEHALKPCYIWALIPHVA